MIAVIFDVDQKCLLMSDFIPYPDDVCVVINYFNKDFKVKLLLNI